MTFIRSIPAVIVLAIALVPLAAPAQSLKSVLLEDALEAHTSAKPALLVVFPERKSTVTDSRRIRYGGAVKPGVRVTLNGQDLKTYDTGAFAGYYALETGKNTLTFTAATPEGSTTKTYIVERKPPPPPLPAEPLAFDKSSWMRPSSDILCQPGEYINIQCKASAGQKMAFRIGDDAAEYPMTDPSAEASSPKGIYETIYRVRPVDIFKDAKITFVLYDKNNETEPVTAKSPGTITVDQSPSPRVYKVKKSSTMLYATPGTSSKLFSLFSDTLLLSDGWRGSMLRISLSPSFSGWVDKDNVKETSPLQLPDLTITSMSRYTDGGRSIVSLGLPARLPVRANYRPDTNTFTLDLFGARPGFRWVNQKQPDPFIKDVRMTLQEDRRTQVDVELTMPLHGYTLRYDGNTCMTLLTPPPLLKAAGAELPLNGVTVCIDPGHGGSDKGAIGNTGLYEKDANLFLAILLKAKLESLGAKVLFSREGDTALSNGSRIDKINGMPATLCISLHNNSIGEFDNPLGARGIGTYYHQPFSKAFAERLYHEIRALCPELRPYGIIQSDHTFLRETTVAPFVLIEGLFISNPLDEALLFDDTFCNRFVEGISDGVRDYVADLRTLRLSHTSN